MPHLAFYTFAIGLEPYGSDVLQGFVAMSPRIFEAAAGADGFLGHAHMAKPDAASPSFGQVFGPWGRFAVPRFYDGGTEPGAITQASTLSLWRDIEPVRRFAYGGLHKTALAKRGEWFRRPEWPTYAMWWVPDDRTPTWEEACRKLEALHDFGPTPAVFSFKAPFDAEGREVRLSTTAAGARDGK